MKDRSAVRRSWIVAAAFGAFILCSVGAAILVGLMPSFGEKCVQQCKPLGLEGRMVSTYPQEMTGARGGPKECKCLSTGAAQGMQ
jgi:hypothetical protein